VAASVEEPRYEVSSFTPGHRNNFFADFGWQIENEKTHKRSAIKEANILGPAE